MKLQLSVSLACVMLPFLPLSSQQCDRASGYVRIAGMDTIAVELAEVHDGIARGAMLLLPERIRVRYSADTRFTPDSSYLTVALWDSASSFAQAPNEKGELVLRVGNSTYRAWKGSFDDVSRFQVPSSTLAIYPLAIGLEELIIQRGRALNTSRVTQPVQVIATDGVPLAAEIQYAPGNAHMDLDELHADYRYDSSNSLFEATYKDSLGRVVAHVTRTPCDDIALRINQSRAHSH